MYIYIYTYIYIYIYIYICIYIYIFHVVRFFFLSALLPFFSSAPSLVEISRMFLSLIL